MTAGEPKIKVVDLLRTYFNNPNPDLNSKTHKGIFPDYPRLDLNYNSYPRISVIENEEDGTYLGVGSTTEIRTATLELAIWAKEAKDNDQLFTIGSEVYANEKLVEYIKRQVLEILQEHWQELGDEYISYENTSTGEILYELERKAYVQHIRIKLVYMR